MALIAGGGTRRPTIQNGRVNFPGSPLDDAREASPLSIRDGRVMFPGSPLDGARVAGDPENNGLSSEDLIALANGLFGAQDPSAAGAGYGGQIDAISRAMGTIGGIGQQRMGGIQQAGQSAISNIRSSTNDYVGQINSASAQANADIGGFYDFAAGQANAGMPVIDQAAAGAQANIDATYNQLASNLQQSPEQMANAAMAAAGGSGGARGEVAARVAAAAAPFAAAGETARAAATANSTQTAQAGNAYLAQLAASAPQEGARAQSGVSARAATSVTSANERANNAIIQAEQSMQQQMSGAELALAEQQMQLEMQQAQLQGAQQRAIAEASADVSGGTFERLMQLAELDSSVSSPQLRQAMGLPADSLGLAGGGNSVEDQMAQLGIEEQTLRNALLGQELTGAGTDPFMDALDTGGNLGFEQALSGLGMTPQQMQEAEAFRLAVEDTGIDPILLAGQVAGSPQGILKGEGRAQQSGSFEDVALQLSQLAETGGVDPETGLPMELTPYFNPRSGKDGQALTQEQIRQLARILGG